MDSIGGLFGGKKSGANNPIQNNNLNQLQNEEVGYCDNVFITGSKKTRRNMGRGGFPISQRCAAGGEISYGHHSSRL